MTATETKVAVEDVMALSPLQQGLFSLSRLNSGEDGADDPYVIAMSVDVVGQFDPELLRQCAAALLARHPNLRASFMHANLSRPVQVVPTRVNVPWRTVTAPADEVEALDADERRRPFDLERGPAIRFLIIEVPGSHWRFVVVAHHILIDGWSLPLFMGELINLYRAGGDVGVLPPPPRPYRDYIGWLAARDQDASRRLWREHLGGMDGPTMVTPSLTAGEPPVGAVRRTELKLDPQTTVQLAEIARSRGVTVNTLMQMSWAMLLSAITDRSDVVFGVTVSGRPSELTGVETMVGLFINTVPLRVRLNPALGVGTQCVALQREAAKLRDHSYLAHSELRSLGGIGEMFDSLLVYENFPPGELVGGGEFTANGAAFKPASLESLSHFPVTIAAHMVDDQLTVMVEAVDGALGTMSPESLAERLLATVQRLISHWDSALRDVSVLLDAETAAAIEPVPAPTDTGVHTKFTETAYTRLGSPALSWSGGVLTYRELDEAADGLAAALVARGVRPEDPVAISLSRGPEYVIAMLGVLKAGGVIVPLDPAMPADRIADILSQCNPTVVVDDSFLSAVSAEQPDDFEPVPALPGQAAYVVFTSGTTGRPKGVVGTHRALLAYAEDHAQQILRPAAARLSHPLRVAHAWSFTFDAAWQPLVALLDGHSVHIVDGEVQRDAEALVQTIARHSIDLIDTTPSMLAQLHAVGLLTTVPLGVLALGGEAIGPSAWDQIRDECARTGMSAYNCYGPTETTVEAVVADISRHAVPTIGRPTAATRAYVLDSWLRSVPDAVSGELYLSGHQLTRGYLGRAGETSARFVADPFVPGERMYRTGDVVRRLPDGSFQFLGRSDAQVKIRGFRVEPGEIAAVLHSHPAVHHAHVAVRRRVRGGPGLMAYVVAEPAPEVSELRAMLSKRLPRYMVPQSIVIVDQMPLTSHGKIDEAALAAVSVDDGPSAAPETETEAALVAVLAELFDGADIDVTAEFLSLGLDSIVALSVVQGARKRGIPLRARLMLECTTIRELAEAIDGEGVTGPAPLDDDRYGDVIPAPIMSWMFEHGHFRRFTQNMFIALPEGLTAERLEAILQALLDRHDMLRSVLGTDAHGDYRMTSRAPGAVRAGDILTVVDSAAPDVIAAEGVAAIDRIDPTTGSMVQAVRFAAEPSRLLMCVHHLATDVVSWYVILSDLAQLAGDIEAGLTPGHAAEFTTYREWTRLLAERSRSDDVAEQHAYWTAQVAAPDPPLGRRLPDPARDTWGSTRLTDVVTDAATTRSVLKKLGDAGIEMRDFLLTALTLTLASWRVSRGEPAHHGALIALEGHGREDGVVANDKGAVESGTVPLDTSATVGWFTSVYPVRLGKGEAVVDVDTAASTPDSARTLLRSVTEQLATVPNRGLDYGLLRYLRGDETLAGFAGPQLEFNYLGRHDLSADQSRSEWSLVTTPELTGQLPVVPEPDLPLRYAFDVTSIVAGGKGDADGPILVTSWRWSDQLHDAADVDRLSQLWLRAVTVLGEAL